MELLIGTNTTVERTYQSLAYVQFWSCMNWVEVRVNSNMFNVEFGQNFASCAYAKTVTNIPLFRITSFRSVLWSIFSKKILKIKNKALVLVSLS